MVRVGIVDSGITTKHPHVGHVAGGVFCGSGEAPRDYIDRMGHGTAVAGVVHLHAPDAELYAVRVFERRLSCTFETLRGGLQWCLENGMHVVNLSAGTANSAHRAELEEYLERASKQGVLVVGAYHMLPGSLPGAVGVASGDSLAFEDGVFHAPPFPRSIPGVPRERNLQGVSFSVAHCSGMLARLRVTMSAPEAVAELQRMGSNSNPSSR